MSSLVQALGIRFPILAAPMAGISTPAMAAAVSLAGGLGSLGVGNVDVETAREMIRAVRTKGLDLPLNVNVFCHRPALANAAIEAAWLTRLAPEFTRYAASPPKTLKEIYVSFLEDDAMLAMLLAERPRVVSFHFGLPSREKIAALHDAKIFLMATATSLAEARAIEAAGVDAIVAQGLEAGGHRGVFDENAEDDALGTFALTRLLVAQTKLPVIATGGIMDGAGIAAALHLGASAAQLGTAFVPCPESRADDGYRAALRGDAAKHTVMTRAISGRPARSLANLFTTLGRELAPSSIPDYPIAYDAAKSLHAAAKRAGEYGFGAQWAGQGAPLARALPASTLTEILAREMNEALAAQRR